MDSDAVPMGTPEYQRLTVPFNQGPQPQEDETINIVPEEIKSLANNITRVFLVAATSYRSAGLSALKSLTAGESLTQDEIKHVLASYKACLLKIQENITSVAKWRQAMMPELLLPLVDGTPEFQKAWSTIEEGHNLVNIMNNPEQVQRLRALTPDRKTSIIAFCKHRIEAFEGGRQSAHEALTFWTYEHESLETRKGFLVERITKWSGTKEGVQVELVKLQRALPASFRTVLDPGHPYMSRGTHLEEEINAIFDALQNAAAAEEESQAEDQAMADDESMEGDPYEGAQDGENEEEWDELSLVGDDTPEIEEWNEEDLEDLKSRLGNPFPVLIVVGEKKFEDRSLYERQFLKEDDDGKVGLNDCVICGEPLNDACLLSTCDHCIAQALNAKKECPACRRSAQHDDLTPLEVTIVEEGGQMDVDG
ncbi:hypothetical protein PRZ48_008910 [Zasmidium cellare]|uniref:RING-type domain-containing protein n=1 Tax=Zasmidium cellare TaxID=395010 RepID=A0ABR0EGV4_ZASCE|nr:hypothetical protein PRZ48_008910 [Zasmidium cellare]